MTKITIVQGDITKANVDAIVNAANNTLQPGGGVDGAIHNAAGPGLVEECLKLGGCNTGEAKITKAYNLPSKFVIHTAGPVYGAEDDVEKSLYLCYFNSLVCAKDNGIKTIAFPSISTGAFRYPIEDAIPVVTKAVKDFVHEYPGALEQIFFVLFNDFDYLIYTRMLMKSGAEAGITLASCAELTPAGAEELISYLDNASHKYIREHNICID